MPHPTSIRYTKAILAFLGLLFTFLVAVDGIVVSSQRTTLFDHEKRQVESEIFLLGQFVTEPLLRGEFGSVEEFLLTWCKNTENVLQFRARAPNGFLITEYERAGTASRHLPADHKINFMGRHVYDLTTNHKVSFAGRHLLDLYIVKDMSKLEEELDQLFFHIILYSLALVSLLALLLWYTLRNLALQPLEKEIKKRHEAEAALSLAKSNLETRVKERTAELEEVTIKLQAEIVERKRAENELKRNYETQTIVNGLLQLTQSDIPLKDFLQKALDLIMLVKWLSNQSRGCIFLTEGSPAVLHIKAERGFSKSLMDTCKRVPYGTCLCGKAAEQKKVIYTGHIDAEHELSYEGMTPHGHYCVPILQQDMTIGLLCVYLEEGHKYDVREVSFLKAIANTLSTIIVRKKSAEQNARLEARLQQSQKMESIGTLAGGIAHDFNNILTPIIGYAEILRDTLEDRSDNLERVKHIYQASIRARDLVKQILSFSRQTEQKRMPLDIHLIIKEALKLLRSSIPSTIDIVQDINPHCGSVLADPIQMHQLIINLCTNAYQAMRHSGGTLKVSLTPARIDRNPVRVSETELLAGSYLKLTVQDTGPGIEPDVKERIFEPYFTTKKHGEGTGMGLAVVHGIVKSHGGHISVDSEPGKGATFHVYLPKISSINDTMITQDVPENLPEGNERILMVDDEPIVGELLMALIKDLGYQTNFQTRSREALKLFLAHPHDFDLVITDMTMPMLTGAELATSILEIRPDMPIILCTGFSETMNKEKAAAIGARGFLMKPVVRKDLALEIRRVLDEK